MERLKHWHTYPRTPKMNAHDERFNRPIQDEFINYNLDDLIEISNFNNKLFGYLLWYNGQKHHWPPKLKSPIKLLMLYYDNQQKCNMWRPYTLPVRYTINVLYFS